MNDAIKLLTGEYKGKRPYIIIEVKDAEAVILTDDEGNDVVYVVIRFQISTKNSKNSQHHNLMCVVIRFQISTKNSDSFRTERMLAVVIRFQINKNSTYKGRCCF